MHSQQVSLSTWSAHQPSFGTFPSVPPWLQHLMFPRRLQALYERCRARPEQRLWEAMLDDLQVRYDVSAADLKRIPQQGPAVVVANHPFGMLEAAILIDMLVKVRPDVRVLTNYLVAHLPGLDTHCIAVDPFGGKDAVMRNRRSLREARNWLQDGGLVLTFPAGEVSSWKWSAATSQDPVWTHTASRLARMSGAHVVPVFVDGTNSVLFHTLGMLNARLRTVRLPYELLNKRGTRVALRVGAPVTPAMVQAHDDGGLTQVARARTYLLASGLQAWRPQVRPSGGKTIVDAVDRTTLHADIEALPAEALLYEDSDFQVWTGRAEHMPAVMRELARQREITFRAVGEGSGSALDTDRFDATYEHLVLWHKAQGTVVGGYRVGHVQALLAQQGIEGLYTSTLFHYAPNFFDAVGPALELGRSFIVQAHQRQYNSLLCLWRGLAQYVARHPHTPVLMGAVSISQTYHASSRALIDRYFARACAHPLRPSVRPRTPLRTRRKAAHDVHCVAQALNSWEELSSTVAEMEGDGKGLPVLMRQYLKLGGDMLGFNVDKRFGHCLDGLVVVDLRNCEPRLLKRLMGDAYAQFAQHHVSHMSQM